jgi:hypothetical protein
MAAGVRAFIVLFAVLSGGDGRLAKPLLGKGGRKLDAGGLVWSKRESRECRKRLNKGQKS